MYLAHQQHITDAQLEQELNSSTPRTQLLTILGNLTKPFTPEKVMPRVGVFGSIYADRERKLMMEQLSKAYIFDQMEIDKTAEIRKGDVVIIRTEYATQREIEHIEIACRTVGAECTIIKKTQLPEVITEIKEYLNHR
jgi:hypothetical protein